MNNGFIRVAAAAPSVNVADTEANATAIISLIGEATRANADVLVFPELCVTGYTCADLFHNATLLDGALEALRHIADATVRHPELLIWVGVPLRAGTQVYNCAVALCGGEVLAAVPKTFIPGYNEFYEKRWFAPAPKEPCAVPLWPGRNPVRLDTHTVIDFGGAGVAAEICEDLWTPVPPSCGHALAGAEVVVNLSASDDLIGKRRYITDLVKQQSARCICAYAYASAGFGESSTDLVFDAKLLIAENGRLLVSNKPWQGQPQLQICDIDLEAIRRDRLHITSFGDSRERFGGGGHIFPADRRRHAHPRAPAAA